MEKARVVVLTDIGPWSGEPDDAQSLVRLMLYSNEYDIEGIIPNASWCGPDTSDEGYMQRIRDVVSAYADVRENLAAHAEGYPDADEIMKKVRRGTSYVNMKRRVLRNEWDSPVEEKMFAYGYYAADTALPRNVGEGLSNDGSELIRSLLENDDPRPLFIELWGGCGTLAQAMYDLMAEDPEKAKRLSRKLMVYDIHGQCDCGAWLCKNFPDIKWYRSTTMFWGFSETPYKWGYNVGSVKKVYGDWLDEYIRLGRFASVYPHTRCGLETDSPSLLAAYPNGLTDWKHLEWGGWGGRFTRCRLENVPAEFFTKTYLYEEKGYMMYKDDVDSLTYSETEPETGDRPVKKDTFATLARWRDDYQNDMAARIGWTLTKDRKECCHNPLVRVNGIDGIDEIIIDAKAGDILTLDFAGSYDPDGGELTWRAWNYMEAGTFGGEVIVEDADTVSPKIVVPENAAGEEIHIIVEAENHGKIPLKGYRRVIIRTGDTAMNAEPELVGDEKFTYSANGWGVVKRLYGCKDEKAHISETAGATAELHFTGRRIALFGCGFRTSGLAEISVDGDAPEVVDFSTQFKEFGNKYRIEGATSVYTTQYLSRRLGVGEHILKVKVLGRHAENAEGNKITIDCAAVWH